MATPKQAQEPVFLVIDAMDAPHRGRILRLRLRGGQPPTLKDLKGASLRAVSPDGEEEALRVMGFFTPGGKPSDARLSRTGRIDLVVEAGQNGTQPRVGMRWEVRIAS